MLWKNLLLSAVLLIGVDVSAQERLKPCPDSPNCVSTLAENSAIEKLPVAQEWSLAKMKLLTIVKSMPRFKIAKDEQHYLHVIYTSRLFGFIDDVEFYIGDKHIDMRSASRKGYYDFGANLKRLQQIQAQWQNL